MYASIFTEDAVWRGPGREFTGRETMVESVAQRIASRPHEHERRHWQNNSVITPRPDGAVARTYFVSFEVSYQPPKPAVSGHYDDILVRTPDGWRRGGPRNSDSWLRWDPDQGEGVWNATEETELSG